MNFADMVRKGFEEESGKREDNLAFPENFPKMTEVIEIRDFMQIGLQSIAKLANAGLEDEDFDEAFEATQEMVDIMAVFLDCLVAEIYGVNTRTEPKVLQTKKGDEDGNE